MGGARAGAGLRGGAVRVPAVSGSFWRQGRCSRRSGGSCLAAGGRTRGSRQGLLSLPAAMERLTLPPGGAAAVDEYLEYRR